MVAAQYEVSLTIVLHPASAGCETSGAVNLFSVAILACWFNCSICKNTWHVICKGRQQVQGFGLHNKTTSLKMKWFKNSVPIRKVSGLKLSYTRLSVYFITRIAFFPPNGMSAACVI